MEGPRNGGRPVSSQRHGGQKRRVTFKDTDGAAAGVLERMAEGVAGSPSGNGAAATEAMTVIPQTRDGYEGGDTSAGSAAVTVMPSATNPMGKKEDTNGRNGMTGSVDSSVTNRRVVSDTRVVLRECGFDTRGELSKAEVAALVTKQLDAWVAAQDATDDARGDEATPDKLLWRRKPV